MSSNYFAIIPQKTAYSKELNTLKPTVRWLYVILAEEAHGRLTAFRFKYEKIIKITGFSSSTIRRGISDLEKAGFIAYEHGGLQNPNEYSMVEWWLKTNQRAIKDLDDWEGM